MAHVDTAAQRGGPQGTICMLALTPIPPGSDCGRGYGGQLTREGAGLGPRQGGAVLVTLPSSTPRTGAGGEQRALGPA